MTDRLSSTRVQLARLGFTDPERAEALWLSPGFDQLRAHEHVLDAFNQAADPDHALLALERMLTSAANVGYGMELTTALISNEVFRRRLVLVLGASEALADFLVRHPNEFEVLADENWTFPSDDNVKTELIECVQARFAAGDPWMAAAVALRISYRRFLLCIAARDLAGEASFTEVTRELSNLADAVLAAGLAMAEAELPADAAPCRIAIIAMGKCGGRELNYISDVDVIFVAEPAELPDGTLADEAAALKTATVLARGVMRAANDSTPEGTIWEVDPALRPEGKSGALVRTLASHVGYYERWAQTWEFQALLKARYAAGDAALGKAYVDAISPFVWSAADRPNFVTDVQAMRRKVESHIPVGKSDRELKLGKGGLRDVEFSVQLLQLVHGRSDVMVRSPNTLAALESMATWGYVGREDAATMAAAYRFLRTMEHRLQLHRLRRTHEVPADPQALRWLGRSMGMRTDPAQELTDAWQKQRVVVRRLHEKLFYRPLLNAVALLRPGEARLSEAAARERLMALGYTDPQGALRHIEALSSGISRRAAIQRTLLPVLLGWFADAPNPDAGLLGFRRVSEALGGTPWYLRLLRDESETAHRMAKLLAGSKLATDLLQRAPEGVALLSEPNDLLPKTKADLLSQMHTAAQRSDDPDKAAASVRAIRTRELLRIVAADVCGFLTVDQVGQALSDLTDATIDAVLGVAISHVREALDGSMPVAFTVIAMGRLGGHEVGYSSDADAMFVYDPLPGADPQEAARAANTIANELRRLLSVHGTDPALIIDADLRPEGRSGALVRTLASYEAYYARWSSPWEAQALLRARFLAGDERLGNSFIEMVDQLRYPAEGISDTDIREVRRLKARMESERLPRGVDPALHVKLGRGGLSDVEWVAQLLQMQYAGRPGYEALKVQGTLQTLAVAQELELLNEADNCSLADAWRFATRIRNASYSVTGRASDVVPTDFSTLSGIGYLMGYPVDSRAQVTEDYLRSARHARSVFERIFYGWRVDDSSEWLA